MTVLKTADDKQPQLDALAALLERPDVDKRTRDRIEDEVWSTRAGIRGEREAAYAIDFHYACRDGYMVIHDLRIEFGGRVAQIDHLLINRVFDIWVCETKAFSEGVKIDDFGEWRRYGGRRTYGMPSPVEQNARHIEVLRDLFEKGAVRVPRRFGVVPIKPTFHPVVLISDNAKVDRPRTKRAQAAVAGLDSVIKIERLVATINRSFDERNPIPLAARAVGKDAIVDIARQLIALHRPATPDIAAKFGLAPIAPPSSRAVASPEAPRHSLDLVAGASCRDCGRAITNAEAEYLRSNAHRFAGAVLCYRCQRSRHERGVAAGRPT